jgi:hypothetical protein
MTLLVCGGVLGSVAAQGKRARVARRATLRFGIYPGGGAGTIGPGAIPKPEDPEKRMAALERLRGGHPFVLHLYANYTGPGGPSAASQAGPEIGRYAAAGFQTELVLCYRPAGGGSRDQVSGFAQFAREAVASLADQPGLISLQVTNEANVAGAPNATDGYYADSRDALIKGVIAAKHEARAANAGHLKVGFNWAYATDHGQDAFWRYLHQRGGRAFAHAVDWAGVDIYPGTWGPELDVTHLAAATAAMMHAALRRLRTHYMALARLPGHVAIHISENGYPTGPGRSPEAQMTSLRSTILAVHAVSRRYDVTDYRWFDLRDADSNSRSFEDQYGLLYDDYTAKPAFAAYHQLIARYSVP